MHVREIASANHNVNGLRSLDKSLGRDFVDVEIAK
jgi:hypothetical protein